MYEAHYNLTARPFQLSPDPGFFFSSRGHKRALSYLRYGVEQGEGFIVITGDIGTGKTTLARALLRELKDKNIVTAQIATTQLEADDLLHMIAAGFNVEHTGLSKSDVLRNLETFLEMQYRQARRVLLLIDEAQNLPARSVEELRMLSNFQIEGQALLQSFLLGQREFRQILQAPDMEQLRQRVIAAYHLNPLALDETRSYIEHRLRTVGWAGRPHFTVDCFSRIYEFTKGVPRQINTLCDRLMLFGFLEEKDELTGDMVGIVAEELLGETFTAGGAAGGEPVLKDAASTNTVTDSAAGNAAYQEVLDRLEEIARRLDNFELSRARERRLLLKAIELLEEQNGSKTVKRFQNIE